MPLHFDASARTTVMVHYFRAMVARADVWRTRMDATTNWAIASSAAVISFVLGDPRSPASGIGIATLLTAVFLLLEARRLTFYHLWQRRVLLLEECLVRPALAGGAEADAAGDPTEAAALEQAAARQLLEDHLGRTVPIMPMRKAVARRFRRVYAALFGVQLAAFALKLAQHPEPAGSPVEWAARVTSVTGEGPGRWALAAGSIAVAALAVALWRWGAVDRGERP